MLLANPAFAVGTKSVTDDAGREVTMPVRPQRIVSLYEGLLTIPALELGLNVVGSFGRDDDGGSLFGVDFIREVLGRDAGAEGIVGTGPLGGLDLERVRALKPDLILGSELDMAMLGQLEKIAPTYVLHTRASKSTGFESQRKMARLLDKEDVYNALYVQYRDKIEEVRGVVVAYGQPDPRQSTAMLVMVRDDISVLRDLTGGMQALRDLGYRALIWSKSGREDAFGDGWRTPLSAEEFPRLNPDLLLATDGFVAATDPTDMLSAKLDVISPGWRRFSRPAQDHRMIFVPSAKIATTTVASAMHMLDAIKRWALENPV
ncbi:ABC transporter substrate-binding protein [Shimia sp. R10_1]|uniref:ABC transporter substrate-binding protein n=1 Tax=Shimia sp. R10_1 TaxID=2821095 RepID=UPI001ADD4A50|nr:ABC transporter substrate-binding protein [Shimia sp. R10_1]MBO9475690.1 ABC transporter substrate-binding protein [Shimia sp. R10_1]